MCPSVSLSARLCIPDFFSVPDWPHLPESAEFHGFCQILRNTRRNQIFQGKINLSKIRRNPAGIRREGQYELVFCATCNEHSVRRHEKKGVNDGILLSAAAATAPRCCQHCCHCLIRGSIGGAGVVACSGGSGSSSSGGSGGSSCTILILVVVVILLLFACPPCRHRPSPFRRRLLFPQATACRPSTLNGWLLFALVHCPLCRCPPSSNHR